MRILVLTPTFLPALGGAELVILQVYRRLATKHAVRVLTPHLSDRLISQSGSNEYDHLLNFAVRHYHDRHTFMKIRGHKITYGIIPPFSLSAVSALRREIRIFRPDVINVHYVMPTGLAGLYAQKISKIPVVMTYNGRDVPGPGVPPLWKYWHRFVGSNCSSMTFVSKYCRQAIYGSGIDPGHVIYNGVEDPAAVSSIQKRDLKARLKLNDDDRVLFCLQRLDPLKRTEVIVQSMPKILQHYPDCRLIVGGKGSELSRLRTVATELNIAERVLFTGFIPQDELPVYFSLADLFLFHSTYETFGLVLAEAMNYGKAIVSVESTAIREIIENGKNGILVPPLNAAAFGQAVVDLLDNGEKRQMLGNCGKRKARQFFQWDSLARQYEKVFRKAKNW